MRNALLFGSFLLALVVAACSGKADVGDSCKTGGATTAECVDGAVCSKTIQGTLTCQKQCSDQKDCPTGTTCNGVTSGNLKSCRPDT